MKVADRQTHTQTRRLFTAIHNKGCLKLSSAWANKTCKHLWPKYCCGAWHI